MKEVDNFDVIIPNLHFDDNLKSIILVWVVKRNKDGNTEAKGNNKNRTIKSYHFQSLEHLQEKREEIISLCKEFNCRAYICINPKPLLNVLFTLQNIVMEHIRENIATGQSVSLKGMMDSAIMKSGSKGNKLWVVDIDTQDINYYKEVYEGVMNAQSGFDENIVGVIPTVHGVHLITHPFNNSIFKADFPDVEIKKEGLTLLYAYVEK